jgi:hypothetical protein
VVKALALASWRPIPRPFGMKERRKMGKGGLAAWTKNARVCREIDRISIYGISEL